MLHKFLSLSPISFLWETARLCGRLGVSRSAAALSYFLILTLFPLLVCVNALLGLFHGDLEEVLLSLDQFLPPEVLAVLGDYLGYVARVQSPALVAASLFTIVLSASAGLRTLLLTMDGLYQVENLRSLRRVAVSVVLSLLFLATVYLSVAVILTGDWFFHLLEGRLPEALARLLPLAALGRLWAWLRYLLLFCFVLLLVLMVYRAGTPRGALPERGGPSVLPGGGPGHRGRLRPVLLVHRPVLPVRPGVRLPGLPHRAAGVAVPVLRHPAGGGGGGPGAGPAAVPLP